MRAGRWHARVANMSKNIASVTPISIAISAINACPRLNNRRINWSADKSVMSKVAIAILSAPDTNKAIIDITAATGVQSWTMKHFIRGRNASGGTEPEVIAAIKEAGLSHVTIDGRRRQDAPIVQAPTPAEVKPLVRINDEGRGLTKPVTLATTNKGEVVTAVMPGAHSSPMVAQGGGFATKTETTRSVIDPNTGDIIVITTRRILYGSVEHRAKMIEMNSKKA